MIGSLFFEVEDVLASTASLRRAALLRTLADEGIPTPGSSDLRDAAGEGTRDSVRRAVRHHAIASDEVALTLLALRADRHFASLIQSGVSLAPGARELIEHARSTCRLAIVTSFDRATVSAVLALAELDGAFEVIVAAEDVASPKPA
ncbi:MAG: HAD hydrolase-like protein, partial [Gemmatimonadaceae bacterium]|nr:HAD hydrolase-like protein [Gemmatimonadaceae bacterium]